MVPRALSRHPRSMTTHTEPTQPRRLTRSTSDRKLGGVAGGLAEHLALDPNVVRVVFARVDAVRRRGRPRLPRPVGARAHRRRRRRAPGDPARHRVSAVQDDGGRGPARHDPHQPLLREGAVGARARRGPLPGGAPRPGHPHAGRPACRGREHGAGARDGRRRPRRVGRHPGLGRRAHAGARAPLPRGPGPARRGGARSRAASTSGSGRAGDGCCTSTCSPTASSCCASTTRASRVGGPRDPRRMAAGRALRERAPGHPARRRSRRRGRRLAGVRRGGGAALRRPPVPLRGPVHARRT